MDHTVTVLMTGFVPQDVKRFIVSRPEGFDFQAGIGWSGEQLTRQGDGKWMAALSTPETKHFNGPPGNT